MDHHGLLVKSKIRMIRDSLKKLGVGAQHLHARGLQTWLKMVESDINSCPFGITMGRNELKTPMLKLISQEQLHLGRFSTRVPTGPFCLPDSPKDMIARVDELYNLWHQFFNDSMLPALLSAHHPKWFQ